MENLAQSQMLSPFFSIVVPTFNSAESLIRCIDSVHNQSYPFKELIIIDGGSNDGTVEIIQSHQHKVDYWETGSDCGIYDAFNKGIQRSNGNWLLFLGGDDFLWSSEVLTLIAAEIKYVDIRKKFVYGKVNHISHDGVPIKTTGSTWNPERLMHTQTPIDHQGLFHHISLFKKFGLYSLKYNVVSDYEFQLRVLSIDKNCCHFFPIHVSGHQHGGVSTFLNRRLINFIQGDKIRIKYKIKVPFYRRLIKYMGAFFWWFSSKIYDESFVRKIEYNIISIKTKLMR